MGEIQAGRCPMKFLWQGQGLGKRMMMLGLAFFLLGIVFALISIKAWLLPHKPLMVVGLVSWMTGKATCFYQKFGAQKRTRTSTKKIFTRT